MRLFQILGAAALATMLGMPGRAQSNVQDNKTEQRQLKADRKADKAQAKADKDERKALKSDKVKKADKQQDKADKAAGVPR